MEVFRIARAEYAAKLTASGKPARWNLEDEFVLYAGSSRSLATLELVVHRNAIKPAFKYKVLIISIADDECLFENIPLKSLPKNWRSIAAYPKLQLMGSNWYKQQKSLVLKVPSSVILNEYNYLINTKHPEFTSKISLVRIEDYFWDERLI